jgi:hypothetical protein
MRWYALRGGQKRSVLKRQLLGDYLIETSFYGEVQVVAGEEPNWWRVRLTKPPDPAAGAGNSLMATFNSTIQSKISSKAETIAEILRHEGPVEHELSFNTRERCAQIITAP